MNSSLTACSRSLVAASMVMVLFVLVPVQANGDDLETRVQALEAKLAQVTIYSGAINGVAGRGCPGLC
jgi:hypothetical protein